MKVCGVFTGFVAVNGPIVMNASTYVLVASPEFGAIPLVSMLIGTPATVQLQDACALTFPGLAELITITHCPAPSVLGPGSSHVLAAAFNVNDAPFRFVSVKSTCAPENGAKPFPSPMSSRKVTVNVCSVPTSFVPSGSIEIAAFTNVLTASAELGAIPSVSTVNGGDPATDPVHEACPATVPVHKEVKVTDTWLAAFVLRLNGPAGIGQPPFAGVSVTATGWPEPAGCKPEPVSNNSVAVNVCGWPTSFVAFGAITIAAFTHSFVAGGEFAPTPFVSRLSTRPPTDTVVCADTVVTPVRNDFNVTWQLPVPPAVVHGFGDVNPPGPESIVKVIAVPSGAFTKPLPSFTFTCAVNVCESPTRSTPFGAIWMFASTTVSGSHGPSEGA